MGETALFLVFSIEFHALAVVGWWLPVVPLDPGKTSLDPRSGLLQYRSVGTSLGCTRKRWRRLLHRWWPALATHSLFRSTGGGIRTEWWHQISYGGGGHV
uniref:Putative secreted protein n=1 Tax=Ixodes ricinus TaxID=34613 RepID=A0A6B0UEM4_IXORI